MSFEMSFVRFYKWAWVASTRFENYEFERELTRFFKNEFQFEFAHSFREFAQHWRALPAFNNGLACKAYFNGRRTMMSFRHLTLFSLF